MNELNDTARPSLLCYDMGPQVVAFSTTRQGGRSLGNYAAFNINRYCGDDEEHIRQNREALCRLLDIADDCLLMPHQTHQTAVACIDPAFLALDSRGREEALEGKDAVMTRLPGLCIGVSTADCIPLLLHDTRSGAVCAVHAGWRGTVERIAEKAVAAMTQAYGTRPADLLVQVGPGISVEHFEVGQEVYDAFVRAGFPMEAISLRRAKWHLDLPACNRMQLLAAGVPPEAIRLSGLCTYARCEQFFSARRLGIRSGRIFTAIMRRSEAVPTL